jgi:hypothetical protein
MVRIQALIISVIIILTGRIASGQDLEKNLNFLQENTVSVKAKKTEYRQTFSQDPKNPYLLTVSVTESDRGKEKVSTVNAMDLNPYRVKFDAAKELMKISAEVKAGKNLVKVVEDGEVKNYDSEILFYAGGIEEARKLTDALKAIVEEANKNTESILNVSKDKQTLLKDISAGITNVDINENSYKQTFSYDDKNNNLISVVTNNSAGNNVEQFKVNAADLNMHKVDFMTRRNEVLISLDTNGDRKLIAYTKNGEIGNYTENLLLMAPSIEQARLLKAQLEAFISLAEKSVNVDYSKYSYEQCVNILKDKIGEVVINQDAYKQKFTPDPDNSLLFSLSVQDVSHGVNYEYYVNAGDLGKIPADFDTKGNSVFVNLKTSGGRNLVQVKKNTEVSNYEDNLSVRAPDIETARELSGVFSRFDELAARKMEKNVDFSNASQAENYALKTIDKVTINTDTYTQSLEKDKTNSCLFTYHFADVSKNNKYDYLFNLKDVDANKIRFDTKGNAVIIDIEIKGKSKLIQVFKDGGADNYVYKIQLKAANIDQGRKLETALRVMTEACSKND